VAAPATAQTTRDEPALPTREPGAPAASRRPKVLAVFNHKGGTAKTTTAVHVAAGLAARGQRVLLVDTDGQGNVATSLGTSFERSLYHVIVMRLDFKDAVVAARPNLDLVAADETLAAAELYLAGQKQRDKVLASRFAKARKDYDVVVVDCSPSLSLLNQNALVMSDAVLCPVACDYLSLVGVRQVVRTVKQVNRLLSHRVGFWGVLPTFFDGRARVCHDALDAMREHFGNVCLEPIRVTSRVKEAPSQGKTLFEYAPTSTAAEDYARVVERFLGEASAPGTEVSTTDVTNTEVSATGVSMGEVA
jgi:chromosome partitioning protein